MSKFTPGPWTVMGHEDHNGNWSALAVAQEQMTFMRVCFLTSDGPAMENARLIAAAPDLLEMIGRLIEQGERCNWFGDRLDEELAQEARELIAKATGEQS